MNKFLKNIPIKYLGELHDIVLVNFSVDPEEIRPYLPAPLKLKTFRGRALFSMVNVKLKRMRMEKLPGVKFAYQHIGFRLLLDDRAYHNHEEAKGIFFYKSFTDRPLMVLGGSLLTDYQLDGAELWNHKSDLDLRYKDKFLSYELDLSDTQPTVDPELRSVVGAIDRAYTIRNKQAYKTQIVREKWPLEPVTCTKFHTNFFKSAKLEGVFRVPEVIYYQWMPPKALHFNQDAHENTHIRCERPDRPSLTHIS